MADLWMYSGVVAIIRASDGSVGYGTSARFQIADHIVARLGAEELTHVMSDLSGLADVGKGQGMTGLLTRGALPRADLYVHGVLLAMARFVSPPQYWD